MIKLGATGVKIGESAINQHWRALDTIKGGLRRYFYLIIKGRPVKICKGAVAELLRITNLSAM